MTSMIPATAASDVRRAAAGAGVWAVVPIKRLSVAKQRLTALLKENREEFAYLLACRTLDVVRDSGLFDGIIVVSPDPRIAAAALARGALVLDDRDAPLNEACSLGLAAVAERSGIDDGARRGDKADHSAVAVGCSAGGDAAPAA